MGFILSFPLIYFLYKILFLDSLGYLPTVLPSLSAVVSALFVGIFIPTISSIIPIRRALSTNLTEALDTNRSKSTGVLISFIDKSTMNIVPYLLYGSIAVLFGVAIYLGLPLAMLQLNLGLILTIFFMILMGLLLGLVLVSVNLQGIVEFFLMHLLLFWETKAMKTLLRKNMQAHKRKNRLTAIIYALTLGCIIFLLTSANLQVITINELSTIGGSDIVLTGLPVEANSTSSSGLLRASMFDGVLFDYRDSIKSFGYMGETLKAGQKGNS